MIYRVANIILTSFLFLFSLLGHASLPLPKQCETLHITHDESPLRHACTNFFQDESFKNYKAHVIYSTDNFSEKVTTILEKEANSSTVFFLVDFQYRPSAPIYINNANVAFVAASNRDNVPAHITFFQPSIPSYEQTGSFLRYDVPDGELLFHNISFDDDVYLEQRNQSESEYLPLLTSLVDIKSAKSVKANNLNVNSIHHQRALSLSCGDKESIAYINIVNSMFTIPAKNAYGVSFHCAREDHTFKVQYAFSNAFLDTSELLLQKHIYTGALNSTSSKANGGSPTHAMPPHPHGALTKSTTTSNPTTNSTPAINILEADIGIFVDVAGKIEFYDSVCNNMQYVNSQGFTCGGTALHEQVLYVTRPETFKGSLSTVISGSKMGYNYSPVQESFEMELLCTNFYDKSQKGKLHYYQPGLNPQSQTANINSLYRSIDYYKSLAVGFGITALAEAIVVGGVIVKYRKSILASVRALRSTHPHSSLIDEEQGPEMKD